MAKMKKTKKGRFLKGMIIYAAIVAIVVIAAMRAMWSFMDTYEKSRPIHVMENYIESFDEEHIDRISEDFLSRVDAKLQPKSEIEDKIHALFDGEIKFARKEGNTSAVTYAITVDGRKLGEATIAKSDAYYKGSVGFEPVRYDYAFEKWVLSSETFDFDWMCSSSSVTVPENYEVSVNGYDLDKSYITETNIPFEFLKEYEGTYSVPHMVTYTVENYVGEAVFQVKDFQGNEISVPEGSDEEMFLNNCTEEVRQSVYDFCEKYIKAYIKFSGNVDKNVYDNLAAVLNMIVPDSTLAQRMRDTVAGLYYAHSKGDTLTALDLHYCIDMGNGNYLADFTYEVDTIGNAGHVTTSNNVKLILNEKNGSYLVASMTSY